MLRLNNQRVLITGATGGIGFELSKQLNALGAHLALQGRSVKTLKVLKAELSSKNGRVEMLEINLLDDNAPSTLIERASLSLDGLDMVINLAGIQTFQSLSSLSEEDVSRQINLNLTRPIQINRAAAKIFTAQSAGTIVNIGSTFGAIAFAHYSTYSASKFGLRGFSEALRRELEGSGVNVIYVAPRATRTSMNSDAVYQMAKETRTTVDEPSHVARQIIRAIEKQRPTTHLGFPEKLFCKVNALFPSLIDKALAKQTLLARRYAQQDTPAHND